MRHFAWRPRLDSDPLFNPFVPSTDRRLQIDRIDLGETREEQEQAEVPQEPESGTSATTSEDPSGS
jgi:hypothetical protein